MREAITPARMAEVRKKVKIGDKIIIVPVKCGEGEQIKKEIPYQVGVYVPDGMDYRGGWYNLKAIKKAKRKDRSKPVAEMLLMMFRSAARDRKKVVTQTEIMRRNDEDER